MNITDKVLRPEDKAIGLTLEDDEDFVTLKLNIAIWLASQVTFAQILQEADNQLEMSRSKSGIEFGKEKVNV